MRERVFSRTNASGRPRINALARVTRDLPLLRWDIKFLAAVVAQQLYDSAAAGALAPIPSAPAPAGLRSKLCCQADIESDWVRYWCGQVQIEPRYHRKVWETAFVLQALWENHALNAGHRGLGFAVGTEPLSSLFAARGIRITATDLMFSDPASEKWQAIGQHSSGVEGLFRPNLVEREQFDRLVNFRPVDMRSIPPDLFGAYDFCWSMCSFEHVGSIAAGLNFVRQSVRCLKPGGLAVHTTEFCLEEGPETLDHWHTVLFQRRHLTELVQRLADEGHIVSEIDFDAGDGILDRFVDVPPYPGEERVMLKPHPATPHLRLSLYGFPLTSVGLIIRAAR